ncbi:MAG: hypothetical protein HUU22_10605 [Phycisphaerae bacterium]|nr:hypothetical protein [Phycisphaerae bacterium]NUQ46473.1 hypothetical protein [Phycisphaerae bacterium]
MPFARSRNLSAIGAAVACLISTFVLATPPLIPMTFEDFHLSGTQIGDVPPYVITHSDNCLICHSDYDADNEPYATWRGSLMANAGRDPLFYAQLTTANQDVGNVGYFCLRCHVPISFVTGHAYQPDGSTLDSLDRDGVNCHFCHAMVDPIYTPGVSPPQDQAILDALASVPQYYGNAMFVLDPAGTRRGPYDDAFPPHPALPSPFHRTGEFCGTCHDVGNVAVTLQPDGTYRYNAIDEATPDENLHSQFPLERTYTEWKLSTFANDGVDMGGRFGGTGPTVVSTCQDCHMPKAEAQGCFFGPVRSDLARHDFAGASAWVLDIIAMHYGEEPDVDVEALAVGRDKAISMLQRAASLDVQQTSGALRVRVTNETGHKLPTGHIEGRRVWLNVRFLDEEWNLLHEYGHYDFDTAELDEPSTSIYEMKIGLSPYAASLTGYPAGETTHMSLADTIVKDNRIPPRGFANAAFAAAGAPVVGAVYPDGQYWDDAWFAIPPGATRAEVKVNYQTVTRHYIEALRYGNVTDQWGEILHNLWLATDKGPPFTMVSLKPTVYPFILGDIDADEDVDVADVAMFVEVQLGLNTSPMHAALADMNRDRRADGEDVQLFVATLME